MLARRHNRRLLAASGQQASVVFRTNYTHVRCVRDEVHGAGGRNSGGGLMDTATPPRWRQTPMTRCSRPLGQPGMRALRCLTGSCLTPRNLSYKSLLGFRFTGPGPDPTRKRRPKPVATSWPGHGYDEPGIFSANPGSLLHEAGCPHRQNGCLPVALRNRTNMLSHPCLGTAILSKAPRVPDEGT